MKPQTSQNQKASSHPAIKRKVSTKTQARKDVAEKSDAESGNQNWDDALKDVFDKCINTLNEDVQSLNPKDRLVFLKAIRDYFSPEDKAKKEPPGSDIDEVEITIIHKCADDIQE